mmetsp:Transcript_33878/g.66063  ORF Transcript_33878/g.66063 Transcript_33878/m.66063 type:complete len:203 (-) Transcript_33878:3133-3741(-)
MQPTRTPRIPPTWPRAPTTPPPATPTQTSAAAATRTGTPRSSQTAARWPWAQARHRCSGWYRASSSRRSSLTCSPDSTAVRRGSPCLKSTAACGRGMPRRSRLSCRMPTTSNATTSRRALPSSQSTLAWLPRCTPTPNPTRKFPSVPPPETASLPRQTARSGWWPPARRTQTMAEGGRRAATTTPRASSMTLPTLPPATTFK